MGAQNRIDLVFFAMRGKSLGYGSARRTNEKKYIFSWYNEMFSHEYSAWSAFLVRINPVKLHLAVASFASCDITSVIHSVLV